MKSTQVRSVKEPYISQTYSKSSSDFRAGLACILLIVSIISREKGQSVPVHSYAPPPPPHVFHTYCQSYLEEGVEVHRLFRGTVMSLPPPPPPPPHVFHTYCLAYLEKGVQASSECSQAVPVHGYVCPPPPPCISHILSGIPRERG